MTLHVASPTVVQHVDRGPLDRRELAAIIARDIPPGSYVNLWTTHDGRRIPRSTGRCGVAH